MSAARAALSPAQAAALRECAGIVGWGLAAFAAVQVAGQYLSHNHSGATAVQAVIAEFAAGKLAIAWSDPHAAVPTTVGIARRAGTGAAMGLGAAALVVAFALATRAASFAHNTPVVASAILGLILAGLVAMRDELLLRGLVLRALRPVAPPAVALFVCGLAGAAAEVGVLTAAGGPQALVVQAAASGCTATAFAALWQRDRGAWLAWGAHTAWVWTTGPLLGGGLLDLRWAEGAWGGGDAGLVGSLAGLVGVAAVGLAAAVWALTEKRDSGQRSVG